MFVTPYVRLDSPDRTHSSGGAGEARWPFPPSAAEWVVTCESSRRAVLRTPAGVEMEWSDPLEALQWLADDIRRRGTSRVRWVGFVSYDLGRLFEVIPSTAEDDLGLPLFRFTLQYDVLELPRDLRREAVQCEPSIRSTFSREQYLDAVRRVIEYISAGDVFQVNLSQRFSVPLQEHPAALYARLRRQSPAWYGGCLCYDDFALLSNSPELFLRVEPEVDGARQIMTRPIKGTRPRSEGMEAELRDSVKDQAELNMIVDLERNDLGRVCEIGSVRVTQPRTVEAHPTVFHGVATIEGVLREDVTFVDLLRATFPGGSITGAPKIRAMEIIEELEPVRRGAYCGAIGYLAGDGTIEFNIAIRTMLAKDGIVHIPVGGGIVADSNPEMEYEETLVKSRAMLAALGISIDQVRT